MSDLIEREDAIKDFADYLREADLLKCDGRLYPMEHYLKKAERHMKRIPSARPKGEWEEREVLEDTVINEWQSARCSECGKYHTTPYMYYFDNFNFCPNCGADMREREDK